MGKTLLGGTSQKGNVSLLTPEQQQLLSSTLTEIGPQASQSFSGLLQPRTDEQIQDIFQQSYVQPALQTFQQQLLPAVQQRFVDANAGASSALNQALAQSAGDLSTALGSQYGQLYQNQQQQQLQALNQFLPLLTGSTFSPVFNQQQGILGPLIQTAGQVGAGYMMSSKKVKENIEDYEKSMEELEKLYVKQYDYIEDVGGEKGRVGFIAEDLPKELTGEINGILHTDIYGLLGLAVNAIKDLNKRLKELEGVG